jgi:hypothetical protein
MGAKVSQLLAEESQLSNQTAISIESMKLKKKELALFLSAKKGI